MRREQFLSGSIAALISALPPGAFARQSLKHRLAAVEAATGGRLGVYAIDGAGRVLMAYRAHERFPMCSTFKLPLAGAVLARVDRAKEDLARRVHYGASDLLDYAPVAREHVAQGWMTVGDLCAAAIEYSDNTAANLLLRTIGGPHALTAYVRTLGDRVTRLDRTEPSLNTAIPGDARDTTTPAAMASDAQAIMLGDALTRSSRLRLQAWMIRSRTGGALLRAGVPKSWRVGDKTGLGGPHNAHGDANTRNDVAIVWPPHEPPRIIAVYLTGATVRASDRDGAVAAVEQLAGTS